MTMPSKWLIPFAGTGPSFLIKGWYPSSTIFALDHIAISQVKKTRIVFGIRPGQLSGHHPEVLYDNIPLPVFSNDSYVIETFSPYWKFFEPIVVKTFFANRNGRCEPHGKSVILIPNKANFFESPADVPDECEMAIIKGRFCISRELIKKHNFYFREIQFVNYDDNISFPPPITEDMSNLFIKRQTSNESDILRILLRLLLDAIRNFNCTNNKIVSAILLDCDPKYGYVIVAIKTSPILNANALDINDFEFPQYAVFDANAIYGQKEYLSRKRFELIIKQTIQKFYTERSVFENIPGNDNILLGYAFHDEDIRWIKEL